MSLKSIELQQVLPKSIEVGRLQHGIQHHPILEQELKMQQTRKQEIRKSQRPNKMEQSALNENNTTRTPNRSRGQNKGRYIDLQL